MALVKRAAWLSWIAVILLAGSCCCVLAALQYRWISEFSSDERARLAADLEGRLNLLARSFNEEISSAAAALAPHTARIDAVGRERLRRIL